MTFVGKLFVLVNVGLSLFWAVAAFALYATGMDWGYDPTKPAGTPGGILKGLTEEIKQQQALQYPIENSWREARVELSKREEDRRAERQFYAVQFVHNREKANADADPARLVEVRETKDLAAPAAGKEDIRNNIAVLDASNRPKMQPGKDRAGKSLHAQVWYDNEITKTRATNATLLKDLDAETEKDLSATEKMIDAKDRRDRTSLPAKGLHSLLVDERAKREGLLEEQRLVRPLFVNTAVESELVVKRLEALEERIKELENYIKKRKMDVALLKR